MNRACVDVVECPWSAIARHAWVEGDSDWTRGVVSTAISYRNSLSILTILPHAGIIIRRPVTRTRFRDVDLRSGLRW